MYIMFDVSNIGFHGNSHLDIITTTEEFNKIKEF